MITVENVLLFLDLCSAIIIFLVGYYVFLKDSKRTINRVFFLLTLAATIWAISSAGLRGMGIQPGMPLTEVLKEITTPEKRYSILLWNNIGWIGVVFLPSTFLHLCSVITNKKEIFKNKKSLFLLYFISFLFLFTAFLKEPITGVSFYILFTAYLGLCLLISFFLIAQKYFSLKDPQERTKLKYFLIGALIPGVGGSILDALIPLARFGMYTGTRFSLYFITAGYLFITQGVLRHSLFVDYREILDTIFKRLSELVIITNKEGTIILTNDITPKKLNFFQEEMIGKNINELLEGEEGFKRIKEVLKRKIIFREKISFLTKEKRKIPHLLVVSLTKEGIIFVGKDIEKLVEYQTKLEEDVRERTKELRERVNELERFYKLTVGRELKMVELKKEIERLKSELGERKE